MNWNERLDYTCKNAPKNFGRKSPPRFYNAYQDPSLPIRAEEINTSCQPLIKSSLQQYRELPNISRVTPKPSIEMAYLCRLTTPLRRTEYLNAEGNCVRANQSVVEMSDLYTANNSTSQCPMIAENCTDSQPNRHHHHECSSCKDEFKSLGSVRVATAHSEKVKGTPKCYNLNTSTAQTNLCLQVCQPPVENPHTSHSVCPEVESGPSGSKGEPNGGISCDFKPLNIGDSARKRIEQRRNCKILTNSTGRWPYTRKPRKNYILKACQQTFPPLCRMPPDQCCQSTNACSRMYLDGWHLKNCCNHRRAYQNCARHSCPRFCSCHMFI